ncbi:hypothetical protein [Sporolactobacillus sp. KGMB 08714]
MKVETIYLSADGKRVVSEEKGYYVIRRFFENGKLVKETRGIKRNDSNG